MSSYSQYQKAHWSTPSLVPHITEQQLSILIDNGRRDPAFGVRDDSCNGSYSKRTYAHMHIYKHTTCLQEAVSHMAL